VCVEVGVEVREGGEGGLGLRGGLRLRGGGEGLEGRMGGG